MAITPTRPVAVARHRTLLTRPEAYLLSVFGFVALLLVADQHVGLTGQLVLGAVTFAVLLASLPSRTPAVRATVVGVLAVATVGEVLVSLVLGVYTYRLGNVPLFVPPGHALLYLGALSAVESRPVQRWPRAFCWLMGGAAGIWAMLGLTVLPQPDLLGALAVVVLLLVLWRGPTPRVYAAAFLCVAYLELYGTWVGTWRWEPTALGLDWLTVGNPPAGAAAGYVLFEALAFLVGPVLYGLGRRALRAGRSEPPPATGTPESEWS